MKLCTEVQVFGTMLITLVLKIPEQEEKHSIAYGRLLLALNGAFVLVPTFEFLHDKHAKYKAQRKAAAALHRLAWESAPPPEVLSPKVLYFAPPEQETSGYTVDLQAPEGLGERVIKRARHKFERLDGDRQSGSVQIEMVKM